MTPQESEVTFSAIFEASPAPMMLLDGQQNIVLLNRKFEDMFGYATSDIPTMEKWWSLSFPYPEYRHYAKEVWRSLAGNSPETEALELMITGRGGDVREVEVGITHLGTATLLLFHDLTSRKKGERELLMKKEQLQFVSDHAPVLIAQFDPQKRYRFTNRQYAETFGSHPSGLEGKYAQEILGKHIFSGERPYMEMALRGIASVHELELPDSEGEAKLFSIHYSPETDMNGKTTGFIAAGLDISQYTEASLALIESQKQLMQAQKMEALGTLVGGIAHDFNNMLASVTANVYLAKHDIEGPPEALNRLDSIETVAFRASEMISQLLSFARKKSVTFERMSLDSFTKELYQFLRPSIPESISFLLHIHGNSIMIKGDAAQLQHMLINLINNAQDALEGVTNPTISLSLETFHADDTFVEKRNHFIQGDYAHLMVKDNGQGIPKQQLEKIFEPFFTTKDVDKGTGLGLSMVYGMVKTHNGFIETESEEGSGTTFHLYFPLTSSGKQIAEPSEQMIITGNGEYILVVEDNAELRNITRQLLEKINYNVLEASDGIEAMHLFNDNRDKVKLIMTDLKMPNLGGKEMMVRIHRETPGVKVIYCTGYIEEGADDDIASDGDQILIKPYSIMTLSNAIAGKLNVQ